MSRVTNELNAAIIEKGVVKNLQMEEMSAEMLLAQTRHGRQRSEEGRDDVASRTRGESDFRAGKTRGRGRGENRTDERQKFKEDIES